MNRKNHNQTTAAPFRRGLKQSVDGFSGETWSYHVFDPNVDGLVPLAVYYQRQGAKENPPTTASFNANLVGNKLTGEFVNDLNQKGRFELWKSFSEAMTGQPAPSPETIGPMKWEEFKSYVAKYHHSDQMLFRGQHSNRYPLRTSYHRQGRNNLFRYLNEDVFRFRHHINAVSAHYYQPQGEDLIGLLSLAQHHGFPTPFLDWSRSPYVAAFFAFDCLTDKSSWHEKKDKPPVRVYCFDWERWRKIDRTWAKSLNDPWPDFQIVHPPAHNNPRHYPQQSVAAFSNVDDIEGMVGAFEMQHNQKFLTRIDIQADQRNIVEDELRFMGITAATLFPGFEGVCKGLRSELF